MGAQGSRLGGEGISLVGPLQQLNPLLAFSMRTAGFALIGGAGPASVRAQVRWIPRVPGDSSLTNTLTLKLRVIFERRQRRGLES
jgi:hypothetical protein